MSDQLVNANLDKTGPQWTDLNPSILESIGNCLSTADLLRARLACRQWRHHLAYCVRSLTSRCRSTQHILSITRAYPHLRVLRVVGSKFLSNDVYSLAAAAGVSELELQLHPWKYEPRFPYQLVPVPRLEALTLLLDSFCQHVVDALPHLSQQLKSLVIKPSMASFALQPRVMQALQLDWTPIARLSRLLHLECVLPESKSGVRSVFQSCAQSEPACQLLMKLQQLQHLRIYNQADLKVLTPGLVSLSRLHTLQLDRAFIHNAVDLQQLSGLSSLTRLDLDFGTEWWLHAEDLSALSELTALQVLNVKVDYGIGSDDFGFDDEFEGEHSAGEDWLLPLTRLSGVKQLGLELLHGTGTCVLQGLALMPQLQQASIKLLDVRVVDLSTSCTALTELQLGSSSSLMVQPRDVSHLAAMTSLRKLHLGCCLVAPEQGPWPRGRRGLGGPTGVYNPLECLSCLVLLRELSVRVEAPSDPEPLVLLLDAVMDGEEGVMAVLIKACGITDGAVAAWLTSMRLLQTLELSGMGYLSDMGLAAIGSHTCLESLTLKLRGSDDVTPQAVPAPGSAPEKAGATGPYRTEGSGLLSQDGPSGFLHHGTMEEPLSGNGMPGAGTAEGPLPGQAAEGSDQESDGRRLQVPAEGASDNAMGVPRGRGVPCQGAVAGPGMSTSCGAEGLEGISYGTFEYSHSPLLAFGTSRAARQQIQLHTLVCPSHLPPQLIHLELHDVRFSEEWSSADVTCRLPRLHTLKLISSASRWGHANLTNWHLAYVVAHQPCLSHLVLHDPAPLEGTGEDWQKPPERYMLKRRAMHMLASLPYLDTLELQVGYRMAWQAQEALMTSLPTTLKSLDLGATNLYAETVHMATRLQNLKMLKLRESYNSTAQELGTATGTVATSLPECSIVVM